MKIEPLTERQHTVLESYRAAARAALSGGLSLDLCEDALCVAYLDYHGKADAEA